MWCVEFRLVFFRSWSKPSAATVDRTGVHVLIVEDDEDSRQLLATFLEYCGALVTMCHSTESALEDLAEYRPHVIVSDLSLLGADGVHFILALRRLEREEGGDVHMCAVVRPYQRYQVSVQRI